MTKPPLTELSILMARVLISFGANIGNSLETIRHAVELLEYRLRPDWLEVSQFYKTPPVGGPAGQPPFVNAVAACSTQLSPYEVWECIRHVEQQLGRQRVRRWEARRIDLDILLYDDLRIWSDRLKIPHPRMCMRRFILKPAADVATDWVDPVSRYTIGQLAEAVAMGAGNLLAVGPKDLELDDWIAEVADLAMASVLPARHFSAPSTTVEADLGQHGRWIGCIRPESLLWLDRELPWPKPKLLMVIADPLRATQLAWEEYHSELACLLGLSGDSASANLAEQRVPRYLLASDDRNWAVHEMVAALEAMDCPVEPIAIE